MPGNQQATVFVGNLDDKVGERVIYEIMIQAGPLVDFSMPRDKEANRHKGYAFAEYGTEEAAQYALKLFTGLVVLNNRQVRFAISGEDKSSPTQKTRKSSPNECYQSGSCGGTQKPCITTKGRNGKLLPSSCRMSARYSPYISPVANRSSAYVNQGVISSGYNMEKNSFSVSNNNRRTIVSEVSRFDHCFSPVTPYGHKASLLNVSRQAFAYPSY